MVGRYVEGYVIAAFRISLVAFAPESSIPGHAHGAKVAAASTCIVKGKKKKRLKPAAASSII